MKNELTAWLPCSWPGAPEPALKQPQKTQTLKTFKIKPAVFKTVGVLHLFFVLNKNTRSLRSRWL